MGGGLTDEIGSAAASKPSLGVLRYAFFGVALVLLVFALTDETRLSKAEPWWLAELALAFVICGATWTGAWRATGIAAASFVAGFAAQLAFRDPVWFQHVSFSVTPMSLFFTAAIGVQAFVAAVLLLRHGIFRHIGTVVSALGWWRPLVGMLVLIVASKAAMDFIADGKFSSYPKHLAVAVGWLAVNLASFAAILLSMPGEKLEGLAERLESRLSLPGSTSPKPLDRAFPWLVATFALLVSSSVAYFALDAVPHLDDVLYLFHARYFAEGLLTLPPVPDDAFGHYLLHDSRGNWFSVNLPGWPLALVPGIWTGLYWLINPVLAAVSVLLLHRFTRQVADRGTANLVIFLLAVSPWYLSTSATMLLHTFTYALILGAWVLLLMARDRPSMVLLALPAGMLMGWLFLTRPLEGLLVGALTGLWALTLLRRDAGHWKTVLLYGLGCVAVGGLIFPYNAALSGSALTVPMNEYLDKLWGVGANALGFGPNRGAVPKWGNTDAFYGHSLSEGLINAQENLYELNSELFGWGGFSLLFALFYLLWGKWTRLAVVMSLIIVATFTVYLLYWCACGFYVGPRYWFMMLVPLLILTALGIRTAAGRFREIYPTGHAPARLGGGLAILAFVSLAVFQTWLSVNRYPGYNGLHADYVPISRDPAYRNALMFVSSDIEREYSNAMWLNNFAEDAETPLFARDLGPERNREVAAAFPERTVFLIRGRSTETGEVAVTAGPLAPGDL